MIVRCPDCPGYYQPISGDGPEPCEFLAIRDRPGKRENQRGQVSIGPSGQEYDETYLTRAGLDRPDVHNENVVRCFIDGNKSPSPALVRSCAGCFLPEVFRRVQPSVLILMGGSSCRIADFPIRLEMHHGRPLTGSVMGGLWSGWIWPMYDPAAGLHDGKQMTSLLEDFENLGRWIGGEWMPPDGSGEVEKDYAWIECTSDFERYLGLLRGASTLHIACDTESHGPTPFSIQISHTPHTGRMIRASNTAVVRELRSWALGSSRNIDWVFHYDIHDLDELARREYDGGIHLPMDRVWDTMRAAYHLGNLPQGLKPLAYRLLGVTMEGWESTVWPASITAWTEWAEAALAFSSDPDTRLQEKTETELKSYWCPTCKKRQLKLNKDGDPFCNKCNGWLERLKKTEYKIGPAAGILKHLLRYVAAPDQDLDTPYHPWKKLAEMRVDGLRGKVPAQWEWDVLEESLGPMPLLGIGNCTDEQALEYAVGDADHTLQVWNRLTEIRQREMSVVDGVKGSLVVDEEDWDCV